MNLPWETTARTVLKKLNIELTPEFAGPFFDPGKFKLVMAGERGGKSFSAAAYAVAFHVHKFYEQGPKPQLIWLIGRDYEACTPEFNGMVENLVTLNLLDPKVVSVRDGGRDKCSFTTSTGLYVETITGADPQKIARLAPDLIVGCEVAQWSFELFQRATGRLAEKDGTFWATGSFEGSTGWLPSLFRHWQSENPRGGRAYSIPSWANGHIFPGGYEDPIMAQLRATMTAARFAERHGGVPAPSAGAVYAHELDAIRITSEAHYDDTFPVFLWVDPGYAGAYSVLVAQRKGDVIDIVDELYERGKTHDDMVRIARTHPWFRAAQRSHGTIDPWAGPQHHAAASAIEIWAGAGVRMAMPKRCKIPDGIDRVMSFLRSSDPALTGLPYLRINPKCKGLIAEMTGEAPPFSDMTPYSYKTDSEGNPLSDVPVQTNNHSCSALAYGLIDMFGFVKRPHLTAPVFWNTGTGGVTWFDAKDIGPHGQRADAF